MINIIMIIITITLLLLLSLLLLLIIIIIIIIMSFQLIDDLVLRPSDAAPCTRRPVRSLFMSRMCMMYVSYNI